jgi:hypothetical protein
MRTGTNRSQSLHYEAGERGDGSPRKAVKSAIRWSDREPGGTIEPRGVCWDGSTRCARLVVTALSKITSFLPHRQQGTSSGTRIRKRRSSSTTTNCWICCSPNISRSTDVEESLSQTAEDRLSRVRAEIRLNCWRAAVLPRARAAATQAVSRMS